MSVRLVIATVLGLLSCMACDPGPHFRLLARFGHLPQALDGPCPSEVTPRPSYTDELDTFRLQVSGAGMNALRRDIDKAELKDKGTLTIDQIPAGKDRHVSVAGMLGKVAFWRGVNQHVEVKGGQTAEASVLLTRLASMTCTRQPMTSARVFASATALADGRVLVAGGYFEVAEVSDGSCPGCRLYSATPTAEIYDPTKGTFSAVGDLAQPRGLHRGVLLPDGRVLLVGGAGELRYDPSQAFPLVPALHRVSMEIFDPATQSFVSGPDDPEMMTRVFHTVTALDDGRVLIAGGGAQVSASDATNKTALCELSGGDVSCVAGPPMRYRRIGHVAVMLDDGRVFFWGGVTDSSSSGTSCDQVGVTQCPEWWRPDLNGFVPVDHNSVVGGASPANNLFFAAASRIGSYGVVISGGLLRSGLGTPLDFGLPSDGAFLYDNHNEVIGNSLQGAPGPFRMGAPRILHQAVPLAADGRAFFAGGYTDAQLTPSQRFDIFDIQGDSGAPGGFVDDITIADQPVLLRQARGGLALVHTGGGAVVALGGEDDDGARRALDTAEIFTDKLEPPL